MNPVRSGGEISYAVLEVIYDDRKVRQSAVHKCHAQLPCKCLARYQARPCLALRTALVHGKILKPESELQFLTTCTVLRPDVDNHILTKSNVNCRGNGKYLIILKHRACSNPISCGIMGE